MIYSVYSKLYLKKDGFKEKKTKKPGETIRHWRKESVLGSTKKFFIPFFADFASGGHRIQPRRPSDDLGGHGKRASWSCLLNPGFSPFTWGRFTSEKESYAPYFSVFFNGAPDSNKHGTAEIRFTVKISCKRFDIKSLYWEADGNFNIATILVSMQTWGEGLRKVIFGSCCFESLKEKKIVDSFEEKT